MVPISSLAEDHRSTEVAIHHRFEPFREGPSSSSMGRQATHGRVSLDESLVLPEADASQ